MPDQGGGTGGARDRRPLAPRANIHGVVPWPDLLFRPHLSQHLLHVPNVVAVDIGDPNADRRAAPRPVHGLGAAKQGGQSLGLGV